MQLKNKGSVDTYKLKMFQAKDHFVMIAVNSNRLRFVSVHNLVLMSGTHNFLNVAMMKFTPKLLYNPRHATILT